MALAERSTTNIRALKMRVEGMDCSACALKIDNALKRLPGVSNINVNYGTETLVLNVDEDRTSLATIEGKFANSAMRRRRWPARHLRPPSWRANWISPGGRREKARL